MRPSDETSKAASVEALVGQIGRELARVFQAVLSAIPGGPHRPQWLARSLGVNTVLTSRLLKATEQSDPIAVVHMIPGPDPLRRVLRAAERKKVDRSILREAHSVVDRFEEVIQAEAGDRSSLDAIISGWLPEARSKVELIAKQSVFRGISQLLGTASDLTYSTVIQYPSDTNSQKADQVLLVGTHGLRRVRPGLVVMYDTVHSSSPLLTVTGRQVEGLQDLLLEQFCSKPLPQLKVTTDGGVAQYTISGDQIGVKSAVDLVHATYLPQRKEVCRSPDQPRKADLALGVGSPSKALTFDILLHEDIYPGQTPELNVYRTVGVFNRPGVHRAMDRIEVIESIEPLGQGIEQFGMAENPRYREMLHYICEQRHWDGAALRGFRCHIEFPIYSVELVASFDIPVKA
jgi:hypothetical protein